MNSPTCMIRLILAQLALYVSSPLAAQGVNPAVVQAVSIMFKDTVYRQSFDMLSASGTGLSALPQGWQLIEFPKGAGQADGLYRASDGSGTTGDSYSFGATGNSDRAIGSIASSGLESFYGAFFINQTGSAVDSVMISYTLEQWRNGGGTKPPDSMLCEYAINRSSINKDSAGWIRIPSLCATSLFYTGSGSALNGNSASNQKRYASVMSGLSLNPGDTFCIRFIDKNNTGTDDALALDSFSLVMSGTPAVIPPLVKFTTVSKSVTEDSLLVNLKVEILNRGKDSLTVFLALRGGTAMAGLDYLFIQQMLSFPLSSDSVQEFPVYILNDSIVEAPETILLALRSPSKSAIIGADSLFTITVYDNEYPSISFVNSRQELSEAQDTLRIAVRLQDYLSGIYTVQVHTSPGTALETEDYLLLNSSLSFNNAEDTLKEIRMKLFRDKPLEASEYFVLELVGPGNGAQTGVFARDTIDINNWIYPSYPIAEICETDSNGALDSLDHFYCLHGIVYGINNAPPGLRLTIRDQSAGLSVFEDSNFFGYKVRQGDSIRVYGKLLQLNGLSVLSKLDTLLLLGAGKAIKEPTIVSALSEENENDLVLFPSVSLAPASDWPLLPFTEAFKEIYVYPNNNPSDSIALRIPATTSLNGSEAPARPFAIMGLVGQDDDRIPYTSHYYLVPQSGAQLMPGDTLRFASSFLYVREDAGIFPAGVKLKNPNPLTTEVQVLAGGGTALQGTDYIYSMQTVRFSATTNSDQYVMLELVDDEIQEANDTLLLVFGVAGNNAFIDPSVDTLRIIIQDDETNGAEEIIAGNFVMYPNPATGVLSVRAGEEIGYLEIYDLFGSLMYKASPGSPKLNMDVSFLKPGVYFVKVSGSKGSRMNKLIIQY